MGAGAAMAGPLRVPETQEAAADEADHGDPPFGAVARSPAGERLAPPQIVELDLRDVDRVGALGPALGLVAHLRALRQRTEAVAVDGGVMDEEVLAPVVGGDEAEALLVAEPLDGSGGHCWSSHVGALVLRGGCCEATTADTRALLLPGSLPALLRIR